jgi:hypothetical protein
MTRKILISLSATISVSLLAAQVQGTVPVQPTKSWTWNNYKMAFQAPTDLAVKENSDKVFYAGNGHVFLTIYPKAGDILGQDELPLALRKWAAEYKLSNSSSSSKSGYLTNSTRYWTYYLGGTGYKGMATYAAIIVDASNPTKSYYVWLQYENGYAGAAMNILNSFSPQ